MRLAIGVMASAAPEVLATTLSYWNEDDCKVYVHVDQKIDITSYDFVQQHAQVILLSDRHKVSWGGFTQVEAEVAMMRAAQRDGFDYFLMISDDAVPLQNYDYLKRAIADKDSWSLYEPITRDDIMSRYSQFWCPDVSASNFRIDSKMYHTCEADYLLGLYVLMKTGKFDIDSLFWSSNWKCLSHRDVSHVLDVFALKGHLYESFKYSVNSDEHYIPTVLARQFSDSGYFRKFMWVDFYKTPKPYVFESTEELAEPIETGYLFARKVHSSLLASRILQSVFSGADA